MASKTFARTLRTASKQKATVPAISRRTFVSAVATRPLVAASRSSLAAPSQQQTRGVKTVDFAGVKETVYGTSSDLQLTMTPRLTDCVQNERTGPVRSFW